MSEHDGGNMEGDRGSRRLLGKCMSWKFRTF
jgi:hypothetical protein